MKKRFTRWIVMMMSVIMVLTSTMKVQAVEGDGAASIQETKRVTVTSSYAMFKLKNDAEGVIDRQTTEGTVDIYTDGTMKLKFVYEGSSFLKMYLGTAEEAENAEADKIYEAKGVEGGYEYELPIESLNITFNAAVLSSKGSWKDNTLAIKEIIDTPGNDTPSTGVPGTDNPESNGSNEGNTITVKETKKVTVTSSYAMFKLKKEGEDKQTTEGTVDIYTDGTMKLKFVYEGSSFLKVYLGTAEEAGNAETDKIHEAKSVEGGYEYELPIENLDTTLNAAVLSSKGSWKDNTLTVKEIKNSTPETGTGGAGTGDAGTGGAGTGGAGTGGAGTGGAGTGSTGSDGSGTNHPDTNIPSGTIVILPNGTYSVAVETGAPMFKVTDCKLVVKNKTINAILTLSGTGYDYLYQGTAEEAKKAGENSWSRYQISTDGKYKYVISIPYDSFVADQVITVAARSARNTTWFDRSLDFDLSSLAVVSASTEIDGSLSSVGSIGSMGTLGSESSSLGNGSSSEKSDNTLSSTEINNKLNTVDKDATVQDGTYVPEFGFTGGSGRATISCSKVVVKNGNATATIVFNSPNFTWVKSLGTTVYNENKGGNSTFTIPVNLNGETKISAETTAMSQPYTVDYTIYCFIDGTKVTTSNVSANKSKSKDVIELEGADTKEKDSENLEEDENAWGSFYDEVETTGEEADTSVQSSHTAVIVLSIILLIVCAYAIAVTVFMVKKIRRIRGE